MKVTLTRNETICRTIERWAGDELRWKYEDPSQVKVSTAYKYVQLLKTSLSSENNLF